MKEYNEIFKDIPSYSRFLKVNEIDDLVKHISELPGVGYKIIGKTIDNQPLGMLEIGKGDKTALIIGVPHSDEPMGSLVITFLARWLATHPEKEFFGWRWLFVPILERRGMQFNEGWFRMPESLAVMAKSNFREPTEDQYEWTFPIDYDHYHWTRSRPETIAVKKVLEDEKPNLLCNLHHSGFHNAYYYLSENLPEVYSDLRKLASNCRMPLSYNTPDVPFGKMFEPGFYEMYGLKNYLKYYKEKDPTVLTTIKRGACSDEWYREKIGGFSFNCEVPLYLSAKLRDKKISDKNYKKILEEKHKREKNQLKYSIKFVNMLKDYSALADPVLLDVAEKHIINAQNSLDHEKRILEKTEDKKITNAEVFEHEVLADIFGLFFLGQIWRVAESICIKGGTRKVCQLMESLDIEIKSLGKSVQERGGFYQLPIRNSVKMQLGSILIFADAIKKR
ncbi:MAG: hypothetical protein BV456_08110 [Thermoplasmata archaeon M8B2D]|nr:MAG: hypothetical protein BV456_08110 [Thermoplasmata archaeon M8B2D]